MQEARRLLSKMELNVDAFNHRSVTRLSVGQQQRVAVARALIGRPELVICDEPTSALDEDARSAFLNLLFREVEAVASTLVFVSHDTRLSDGFDRTIDLPTVNRVSGETEGIQ